MARAAVGTPSASNGLERRPRTRRGSSCTWMPAANTAWPSMSFRKLVPRTMVTPLIAAVRWFSRLLSDPRVVHHRQPRRPCPARVHPRDRPRPSGVSDFRRVLQVRQVDSGRCDVVVPLHVRPCPGERHRRHRVGRARIPPGEPGRRSSASRPTGYTTPPPPPSWSRPDTARAACSATDARATNAVASGAVGSSMSSATGVGRQRLLGQAAIRILRHHARHRHRALRQCREPGGIGGRGRHDGRPAADEDAQAEVARLRLAPASRCGPAGVPR